jgi:hypothetical protein
MHFNRPVRGFYHRGRPSFRGKQFASQECIQTVLDVDKPVLRGLVEAHLRAYLWRTGVGERESLGAPGVVVKQSG